MAITTVQPSAVALAEAAAAIFLASASDSVLRVSIGFPSAIGNVSRLVLAATGVQDEFGVAVGLIASLEDQIAGCCECDVSGQVGRHGPVAAVAGVLLIDDLRHAR